MYSNSGGSQEKTAGIWRFTDPESPTHFPTGYSVYVFPSHEWSHQQSVFHPSPVSYMNIFHCLSEIWRSPPLKTIFINLFNIVSILPSFPTVSYRALIWLVVCVVAAEMNNLKRENNTLRDEIGHLRAALEWVYGVWIESISMCPLIAEALNIFCFLIFMDHFVITQAEAVVNAVFMIILQLIVLHLADAFFSKATYIHSYTGGSNARCQPTH